MMTPSKRLLFLFSCLLTGIYATASTESENSLSVYGFVRSDFFYDNQVMRSSVQELFSLYPAPAITNVYGDELNRTPSAGLNSLTTRLGLKLKGNGMLGAGSSQSVVEVDFGGAPNYWLLRLRQAYSKLHFASSELLIGQTWHPLFAATMMPMVLSLNTGAPFQPFNRSPQIRWDKHLNNWTLTAAGIWQMMYASPGPDGSSYKYQRDAILPNIYIGAEWKSDGWLGGVGYDVKRLKPQRYVLDNGGAQIINRQYLTSSSVMVYGQYAQPEWAIRFKAIQGQNLADHTLIGGYALTPDNRCVNYNTFSSFINVVVGTTHQGGLFAGYSANQGPSSRLTADSRFFGMGADAANTNNELLIKHLYRLTPTYAYQNGAWRVGVELELTQAQWAKRQADGHLGNTTPSANQRVYAILMYRF
ncbi:MAG TPA: hypothetical protein DD409_04310 [Bacteroidales bacterium]|nr:hypothetical protein [Bacteroidales bacterium]